MSEFIELFKKNIKLITRGKFSLFFLLIFPLLVFILLGVVFLNQTDYNFTIGSIPQDKSDLYFDYLEALAQAQFTVVEFETLDECLDFVKGGSIHSCVVFPDSFELTETSSNTVEVVFDSTNEDTINVLENVLNTAFTNQQIELQRKHVGSMLDYLNRSEFLLQEQNKFIESLKFDINKAKNQVSHIKTVRSGLDESFDPSFFAIAELQENSNNFEEGLNTRIANVNDRLDESLDEIRTIQNRLGEINATGIDTTINELDTMHDDISDVQGDLFGMRNPSLLTQIENFVTETDATITQIEEDLDSIDELIVENMNNFYFYNEEEALGSDNVSFLNRYLLSDLNETVEIRNIENLLFPVKFESRNIDSAELNDEFNDLSSNFYSLLNLFVVVLAMFLGASFTFKDKTNRGSYRLLLNSVMSFKFVLAAIFSVSFIVLIQTFLIVSIYSYLVYGNALWTSLGYLLVFLLLSILTFTTIGILIGTISKSETTYILSLFGLVFLFLIGSGKVVPLEKLPEALNAILFYVNPYLASEAIFRKVILFSLPVAEFAREIYVLVGFVAIIVLILGIVESYSKRRGIYFLIHRSKRS